MGISNRTRLALDGGLFVALLVAFSPATTGISVHEWLSLAIILPALFHLIINWDWVVHALSRLLGKLRAVSRANLLVDAVLFVSAVTVMLSGFMVSQSIASALGVTVVPALAWHVAHSFSAKLSIILMVVHLGLHWRWVLRTARSPRTEERCLPAYSQTP